MTMTSYCPRILTYSFLFIALALSPLAMQAQAKIGTVDLTKVFDQYWKTKQADANLKERQEGFQGARKGLIEDYEQSSEEYKKMIEEANDQALSQQERDRKKREAEAKLLDIKEIETSISQFDRQASTTLSEQRRRMRDSIVGEITEVIRAQAVRGAYTLIFDSSGMTMNQTSLVLYTDGSNDLTPQIVVELNRNAPAQFAPQSGN